MAANERRSWAAIARGAATVKPKLQPQKKPEQKPASSPKPDIIQEGASQLVSTIVQTTSAPSKSANSVNAETKQEKLVAALETARLQLSGNFLFKMCYI